MCMCVRACESECRRPSPTTFVASKQAGMDFRSDSIPCRPNQDLKPVRPSREGPRCSTRCSHNLSFVTTRFVFRAKLSPVLAVSVALDRSTPVAFTPFKTGFSIDNGSNLENDNDNWHADETSSGSDPTGCLGGDWCPFMSPRVAEKP